MLGTREDAPRQEICYFISSVYCVVFSSSDEDACSHLLYHINIRNRLVLNKLYLILAILYNTFIPNLYKNNHIRVT